jgi:hypothetical protein
MSGTVSGKFFWVSGLYCTGYADKCPVPCRENFSRLAVCIHVSLTIKTEARAKRGVPSALTMNLFSAGPGGRGMPVIMNFLGFFKPTACGG